MSAHATTLLLLLALATVRHDHGAPSPTATTLLTEKDALAWAGAPLGGAFERDQPATPENGHDHTTVRAFVPKGYDFATAEAPPARGVLLTVHAFRADDDARSMFEHLRESAAQFVEPGGPFEGHAFADVDSLGDQAFVRSGVLTGDGAPPHLAVLTLRRGAVVAQLQLWRPGEDADKFAMTAGRALVARLP